MSIRILGFAMACWRGHAGAEHVDLQSVMRTALLTIVAVAVAVQADLSTQTRAGVVGTWRLVSASASTADGRLIAAPFGQNPTGVITYTPDGRMTAMISYGGRRLLSGDRISSPASERAEAFATFFAYAGRYSVNGDRVIHHVDISSVQNWVNTDMERLVKFDGARTTLRTPPLSVGGTTANDRLGLGTRQITVPFSWQRRVGRARSIDHARSICT